MISPWQFAVPVRRSRFVAIDDGLSRFNVEIAQGAVAPFAFDASAREDVLHYDAQTQLDGTWPGRLGAGRAGFYQGHYLKGVGRTPAAANWNEPRERYHGTGHLAPASAANERLVSAVARRLGFARSIVPCVGLLAGALTPAERASVSSGKTSAAPARFAVDGRVLALSVKRGGFARMANVVFALDHVPPQPAQVGALFLAIERAHGVRRPSGDPDDLAEAMDAAFTRGLASFEAFARVGLAWLYLQNNFTLDGRFVDLELPLFLGVPAAGIAVRRAAGGTRGFAIGFETFGYVAAWRAYVRYLDMRLAMLDSPLVTADPRVRVFMRAVRRAVLRNFGPRHALFDDAAVRTRAVDVLADALGATRRDRAALARVARWAWVAERGGDPGALPDGPELEDVSPPLPMRIYAPSVVPREPSPVARAFAAARRRAGESRSPRAFLESVELGVAEITKTR